METRRLTFGLLFLLGGIVFLVLMSLAGACRPAPASGDLQVSSTSTPTPKLTAPSSVAPGTEFQVEFRNFPDLPWNWVQLCTGMPHPTPKSCSNEYERHDLDGIHGSITFTAPPTEGEFHIVALKDYGYSDAITQTGMIHVKAGVAMAPTSSPPTATPSFTPVPGSTTLTVISAGELRVGKKQSYALRLDDGSRGISGLVVVVRVSPIGFAQIVEKTGDSTVDMLGFGVQKLKTPTEGLLGGVDLFRNIEPGPIPPIVATIVLEGVAPGTLTLNIADIKIHDEKGDTISISYTPVTINVIP